jgi:hypothetical protein
MTLDEMDERILPEPLRRAQLRARQIPKPIRYGYLGVALVASITWSMLHDYDKLGWMLALVVALAPYAVASQLYLYVRNRSPRSARIAARSAASSTPPSTSSRSLGK